MSDTTNQAFGLIRMNAHLVRQGWASALLVAGIAAGIVAALWLASALLRRRREQGIGAGIALAVALAVALIAARQPKVNIIRACAVGPVSLEVVAANYRILEIDGSMLTLTER